MVYFFAVLANRFLFRIIEVSENSANSIASLQTLTRVQMLRSLDNFVSAEEARLSSSKEEYMNPGFDYVGYCNSQVCRTNK